VSDRVIDNPIINSPYEPPGRHFAFDSDGITDRVIDGRRPSSFFIPVPRPRKQARQLELQVLTEDDIEPNKQVNDVRERVDAWRAAGWPNVTPVTRRLLEYWADPERENKILFCQREAAETAIFLAEGATKWHGSWINNDLEHHNAEHNNGLPRVALKMATGSGKTIVMAMLIAWHTINKVHAPYDRTFAKRFLVVTPGLTIRDRLRVLLPEDPGNYYRERDLVPAEFTDDLGQAKIVITNFHAFKPRETRFGRGTTGNTKALVAPGRPDPFQETPAQVVSRVLRELGGSKQIVVFNDEAHHCYRGRTAEPEAGADTVENLTGEERKEAAERAEEARLWFTGLEYVRDKVGIKRVYDLSATPFFLAGSGYREGTLFPWVVSDFSLIDAIESGIVKIPRVPGAEPPPVPPGSDIRKGFVYERVPHVTLKSIANNPDIKEGMTRKEIDAAIARHAETELLYDRPYEDRRRIRVAGKFTVESLSPHRSARLELGQDQPGTTDADGYLKTILDNLVKAGVQNGWRNERLEFASLTPYPGTLLHAEGARRNGGDGAPDRIAVSVGPQYGTVDAKWVKDAAREALKGVGFDLLLVCAFGFDARAGEAAGEFEPAGGDFAAVTAQRQVGRLPILLVRMNADLAKGGHAAQEDRHGQPVHRVRRARRGVRPRAGRTDRQDSWCGCL
jgi:hypothetical protein